MNRSLIKTESFTKEGYSAFDKLGKLIDNRWWYLPIRHPKRSLWSTASGIEWCELKVYVQLIVFWRMPLVIYYDNKNREFTRLSITKKALLTDSIYISVDYANIWILNLVNPPVVKSSDFYQGICLRWPKIYMSSFNLCHYLWNE
jgi:hypothetical protein